MYYLYHIPGKKIGVTTNLTERVENQQGYEPGEYQLLMSTPDIDFISDFDPAQLTHPSELELLKTLDHFPEIMTSALKLLEPHDIANYIQGLAAHFHRFYVDCRVITDDNDLSAARIALIKATKIVIANGLKVLSISAPERM